MPAKPMRPDAPLKRRTRQHIIEDLSRNAVERQFFLRGHTLTRPAADYGTDLIIHTYDHDGFVQAGLIHVQLKATDHPKRLADGSLSFQVEVKDLTIWMSEPMPVFLILYDANGEIAYWQSIQAYFRADPRRLPRPGRATVTVRLPAENILNARAVDYIQESKQRVLARLGTEDRHAP